MSRTFTLSEAQTLLPVAGVALLRRAQTAGTRAAELERGLEQLRQQIFLSGRHARRRQRLRRAAGQSAIRRYRTRRIRWLRFDAIGVLVKDLEKGLLDFPTVMDGKPALLCWKQGEPAIAHWHTEEEGFAGRKPLDPRLGKTERLN